MKDQLVVHKGVIKNINEVTAMPGKLLLRLEVAQKKMGNIELVTKDNTTYGQGEIVAAGRETEGAAIGSTAMYVGIPLRVDEIGGANYGWVDIEKVIGVVK